MNNNNNRMTGVESSKRIKLHFPTKLQNSFKINFDKC